MNATDTKTPAETLEGTNIPEFFAAAEGAVEALVGFGEVTLFRNGENKRAFLTVSGPNSAKAGAPGVPSKPWEKIVTFKCGAHAVNVTRETLMSLMRSAAAHALGYYWAPVKAGVANGQAGLLGPKQSAPKGFKLAVTAKPYPAGFSH